jgi:hypothetical protein
MLWLPLSTPTATVARVAAVCCLIMHAHGGANAEVELLASTPLLHAQLAIRVVANAGKVALDAVMHICSLSLKMCSHFMVLV